MISQKNPVLNFSAKWTQAITGKEKSGCACMTVTTVLSICNNCLWLLVYTHWSLYNVLVLSTAQLLIHAGSTNHIAEAQCIKSCRYQWNCLVEGKAQRRMGSPAQYKYGVPNKLASECIYRYTFLSNTFSPCFCFFTQVSRLTTL